MSFRTSVRSVFVKGYRFFRARGMKETVYWIYYGYLKSHKFYLFVLDLDNLPEKFYPAGKISIKKMPLDELKEYRKDKNLPMNFYCDKFDGARHCFTAMRGDSIAHILWIYTGGDKSRFFVKKKGDAEVNYALTTSGNHGKGLYSITLRYAFQWLKKNNYKRAIAATNIENFPAAASLRKAGMREHSVLLQVGPIRKRKKV